MTTYEFYFRDDSGEFHLLGVLPERRSNPERITDESIINWARNTLGEESGFNNIYYNTIKLAKDENKVFYTTPLSQKEL